MGAKTWLLAYVDGSVADRLEPIPALDKEASLELAEQLFPKYSLQPTDNVDLTYTAPPGKNVFVGCFPGVSIITATEFALDRPSTLPRIFIDAANGRTIYLHAMHSVVDWFAYAIWENGQLKRSLSLAPDSGIMEDIGSQLPFEEPFWSGVHPAEDPADPDFDYPFCFHPLDMAEAALLTLLGYQLEGFQDKNRFDPETIELAAFKRSWQWWKFW